MVEKANILLDNLSTLIAGPVREEFGCLFRKVRMQTGDEEMILPNFQDTLEASLLARSPEADEALLARVMTCGKCPWIRDLVMQASEESARVMGRQPPAPDTVCMASFLRTCVTLAGRQVFRNPIVMYDRYKRVERERNRALLDAMIRSAVGEAVTGMSTERVRADASDTVAVVDDDVEEEEDCDDDASVISV